MSRQEKLQLLRNYKEALVYATGYESKEERDVKEREKKEPQKVLVLRKKWYNQDRKVA